MHSFHSVSANGLPNFRKGGRVRLKALVLKTRVLQGTVGSNPTLSAITNARLAQLVERGLYTADVGGSNPSSRTILVC